MDRYDRFDNDIDSTKVIKIKSTKEENKKGKNKSTKKRKAIKIMCISLVTLLIIGAGVCGYIYYGILGGFNSDGMPIAKEPEKKGIVNILVMGKDKPDKYGTQRTDTIMLVNFNMENKDLNVVSIPRDTEVINSAGQNVLVNSLYQSDGIEYLSEQIEEMLKITVNYTVQIDSLAFQDFINAIGGVTVTPKCNMKYSDPEQGLYIDFDKDKEVHLDGENAESYFRWRKNNISNIGEGSDGSDLARIKHQQEFLGEIFEKCKSPEVIGNANDILKVIQKNVSTNIKPKKMLEMALELKDIDRSKINMTTIATDNNDILNSDGTITYGPLTFNKENNIELLCKLNPELSIVDLKKSSMYVAVLNGSGVMGLADQIKEKLVESGYDSEKIITGNTEDTEIGVVQSSITEIGEDLSKESGISNKQGLSPDYEVTYDAVIIIGKDYK